MSILKTLSKKDKKWRNISFNICKDRMLADDLVQEMYLKANDIYNRLNKELNDQYIGFIIRHLFIDYCRKKKNISIEELHYIQSKDVTFEPTDKEHEILSRYKNINWKTQILLEEIYDMSLREIELKYPLINYGYAYRQIKQAREMILKPDNYE